jgi:N-acetylneuraminic acid mutarotase
MSIYSVYTDYYYDDVYAQGGSSQSEISSPWPTGAPLPTPRSEIAGAALKGKIYIIGGYDQSGQSTATVEVYDPIADRWTNAAPLPQPLDHTAAATSYDGKLYVVGGGYLGGDTLSNKLFIYDPTTNKWTEGANLPAARGALTANFINGILYAVGGVDVSGTSNANLA